jgi:hypothetical protein
MEEKLLRHLLNEFRDKEKSLQLSLGDGAATDYAAYQNMCGQIKGLVYAQSIVNDLLRKMEQINDE